MIKNWNFLFVLGLFFLTQGWAQETADTTVWFCEECLDVFPPESDIECCYRWEDLEGNIISTSDTIKTCEVNQGVYKLVHTDGAKILKTEKWSVESDYGRLKLKADRYEICNGTERVYLTAETYESSEYKLRWSANIPGETTGRKQVYVERSGVYWVSLYESTRGCRLKEFIEIKNKEEICGNGVDDNCNDEIDCEDEECDDILDQCECEYFEIIPIVEECNCEKDYSLTVESYSSIEKIIWSTGEETMQLAVQNEEIYQAEIHFSNGTVCNDKYEFKKEQVNLIYEVHVTGNSTDDGLVICDEENNTVFSSGCTKSKITMELFGEDVLHCNFNDFEWYLKRNGSESLVGKGKQIKLSDDFQGIIDIRNCGISVFEINKKLHSEHIVFKLEGGCDDQLFDGKYGWDNTEQIEFRNNGNYEFTTFDHPNGEKMYSPILSLRNEETVKIQLDLDEISQDEFSRDPNFYIQYKSANRKIIVDDSKRSWQDLQDNPTIEITSKLITAGGNASSPSQITIEDNCSEKVNQVMVVSGRSQVIDLTIVPVGIVIDSELGDFALWDTLRYPRYESLLDEYHINNMAFNQLFREIKIKIKKELVVTSSYFARLANSGVTNIWYGLASEYPEENGPLVANADGGHQDIILFVFGAPAPQEYEGLCTFSEGTYGNITKGGEGFMARSADINTLIHELGHGLRLCHPFMVSGTDSDCINSSLMQYADRKTTCDYMSYSLNQQSFFYHHWLDRL